MAEELLAPDPKRTGVKATLIPRTEPPLHLKNHRWHGPPGAFLAHENNGPSFWRLCCPSCGELGSPREGAKWVMMTGDFTDVSKLTLRPSIARSCCGWHGWLTDGVFEITKRGY